MAGKTKWSYGKPLNSWKECADAMKSMKPSKSSGLRSRLEEIERRLKLKDRFVARITTK